MTALLLDYDPTPAVPPPLALAPTGAADAVGLVMDLGVVLTAPFAPQQARAQTIAGLVGPAAVAAIAPPDCEDPHACTGDAAVLAAATLAAGKAAGVAGVAALADVRHAYETGWLRALAGGVPGSALRPGALEAVRALTSRGVPVALTTPSLADIARATLAAAGAAGLFTFDADAGFGDQHATGVDRTRAAVASLGHLDRVHVLCSGPGQVRAAICLGMPAIGVATATRVGHALTAAGATRVLPDLPAALAHLDDQPGS